MQRLRGCHSLEIAEVQRCIYVMRDAQVMLDRDLAALYGVEVKQLNRQVKRNIERFPSDFMFQLSKEECSRCQIGTLNGNRGSNVKYLPYAFTENGIAMLSGVLKSKTAIEVNISIMRASRDIVFNARCARDRQVAGDVAVIAVFDAR